MDRKKLLVGCVIATVVILLLAVFRNLAGGQGDSLTIANNNNEEQKIPEETLPTPVPTYPAVPSATPKPLPSPTPTPVPTVSPTPMPSPTVTSSPGQQITVSDGSQLEPQEAQGEPNILFIGDSRAYSMSQAAGEEGNVFWFCQDGMDPLLLEQTVSSDVPPFLTDGSTVVVSAGLDSGLDATYVTVINAMAAEWSDKEIEVWFAAVGPVSGNQQISNQDIMDYNTYLYNNLQGVGFIDVYNFLVTNGFTFDDGDTYDRSTSSAAYQYILSCI